MSIPLFGSSSFHDQYDRKVLIRPWVHPLHAWVGHAFFPEDGGEGVLIYYVPDEKQTSIHVHRTVIIKSGKLHIKLETDPDPDIDDRLDSLSWDW